MLLAFLIAAHEINGLWLECLVDAGVEIAPDNCPGDHRVAEVIAKQMNNGDPKSDSEK